VYTYTVVAIDLDGSRSAPTSITLNVESGEIDEPGSTGGSQEPPDTIDTNIIEPSDLFSRDGYSPADIIRVDLRTVIGSGPCNADDESGCTLADVMADVDKSDDHTVDIAVHFKSDDFPDDGAMNNAKLRLRGGGSRSAPQKSFRIKLDSKKALWRDERYLQLNKHPFESSRIRNKLAMDVMADIPNLPSVRTQFVNLWIDDGEGPVDYGLFTHVERVNNYFLRQRDWDDDGNLYKAELFLFTQKDLKSLQVDSEGEPIDEDLFENVLSIENGDDHRALVVIPWDYDEAMGRWKEPPNDLSNSSLRLRLDYGYAVAGKNVFLDRFYKLPGIHEQLLATIDNLRQNVVTDEAMADKANHYINLVEPSQLREPDSLFNPEFTVFSAFRRTEAIGINAEALRSSFGVLMAPLLADPQLQGEQWIFNWTPAYDVTGASGGISYQLQIATSPTFEADSVFVDIGAIDDAVGNVEQTVDAARLPAGEYFARLIATPENEPTRFWQVSANRTYLNNQNYYGVLEFEVPSR